MNGKVNVTIRGKTDLTRRRHQISVLMKKAMRGGRQAKDRLQKEFGVRMYSSDEIGSYVKERLKTEVVEDSPSRPRTGGGSKAISKRKSKRVAKRR